MPYQKNSNEHKVLYINARIIDPKTSLDIDGNLLTIGNKIADFSADLKVDEVDEIIDCKGNILMPGVIDIHVHLRDPGFGQKENIESGTKAAAAGGVTTVVCQPNTNPKIEDIVVLAYVQKKAKEVGCVNVEVYASITKNSEGQEGLTDMYSLYQEGVVGFTNDGLSVANAFLMKQALSYSRVTGLPIAQHAEDLYLSNCGCMNEGAVSQRLNVPGIPNSSESSIVARDLLLLEEVPGAHYHLLHISTKQSMELIIQAKKKGLNVTCEVTPHHLLLTEEELDGYNTLAKVNPPLRREEDRLCLLQALKNGYIDAIASDHAPHEKDSKETTLEDAAFGISGVETMLPLSLQLYHNEWMTLYDLLAKLTCNPAAIIKSQAGQIKKGAPADLIILDLNQEWEIDINKFYSKSNNSPFGGTKVKGKVLKTIVSGKMVFDL